MPKIQKEKITKYFKILLNTFLTVVLFVAVAFAFSLLPIKNNYKVLIVKSGSMEPEIKTGSIVVSFPANDYKIGDVISFAPSDSRSGPDTVTHRIYGIDQNTSGKEIYYTKGDANKTPDGKAILGDQILGKKVFSMPHLGYVIGYTKTLPGLFLIVIIPALIIIYLEIENLKKEFRFIFRNKETAKKIKKAKQYFSKKYYCKLFHSIKKKYLKFVSKSSIKK